MPAGVRDLTIGAGVAVAPLMVLDAVAGLFQPCCRAVLLLPFAMVVMGAVATGSQRLDATTAPAPPTIAWGAVTMVVAAAVSWTVERVRRGPAAGGGPLR